MKRYAWLVVLLTAFTVGQVAAQFRMRFVPPSYAQASELSAGDIVIRASGACGAGFAEVSSLEGKFLRGTLAANMDQGDTGGSDAITPTGANSNGAVSAHSGTAVANHASHTHTYTDVPNHVHPMMRFPTATGGSAGFTVDTSMSGTQTAVNDTGNPTGGVATGTTAGPNATLTHAVTQPDNHTFTQPTWTGDAFNNRPAYTSVIFCEKQ